MLLDYNRNIKMQKISRARKTFDEKENDQKHLNKKSSLISSLNFKPSVQVHSLKSNFSSLIPSSSPTQSNETNFCRNYSNDLQFYYKQQILETPNLFLKGHEVTSSLRARMLDWMVEVTQSYKFRPKTYFVGVQIMDQYFFREQQLISIDKLHLIGVVSMLIASKMQQVFPFRLKTVHEKIVHKKIPVTDIISLQAIIFQTLNFNFVFSTFLDRIMFQIYSRYTTEFLEQLSLSQDKLEQIQLLSSYIGKFAYYNYEIVSIFNKQMLCDAILVLTLQILNINVGGMLQNLQVSEIQNCKSMLISTIVTFRKMYKGLNNIFKFTKVSLVKIVDDYFQIGI